MKKLKRNLKKWGLIGAGVLSLLAWGIITGAWGYVILTAYGLGSFIAWAIRESRRQWATLIVLLMLPAIADKIQALESWQRDAERHVIAEARQFEAEILDYNTEDQLFDKGQYSDGTAIQPPYRPLTIQIKQAKGQPTGRVTLRDEGDFHRSFYIIWGHVQFRITSQDSKANKLVEKYGGEIFGLDDNSRQDLIDNLKGPLLDNLKKALDV